MRVIRTADQVRMPWKNGGGETIEIARGPEGSSLDTFGWRVSRARIGGAGAFSRFGGIDRTLSVLDGAGVSLSIEGGSEIHLTRQSQPFAFDGGLAIYSRLSGGAVTDLNVMTRRGSFVHKVESLAQVAEVRVSGASESFVFVLSTGPATIETAQSRRSLEANDVVQLAADESAVIRPENSSRLYLIEISPVSRVAIRRDV